MISASRLYVSNPRVSSKVCRRVLISLQTTRKSSARGQIARLPVPADGSKRKRLNTSHAPALRFLASKKPHAERPARMPKPMPPRSGNQRQFLAAQSRIEIDAANSLQEFLLQEPFLYPHECQVIVFHRDHHHCLVDEPRPKPKR